MRILNRMTVNAITVSPETEVEFAYRLMKKLDIRNLPVVDQDGVLLGIVTDRDFRQVLIPTWMDKPLTSRLRLSGDEEQPSKINKESYHAPEEVTVSEVMTRDVVTVHPDTDMYEAIGIIYEHKFGALPVVDDEGKVVGILTRTDLIALLFEMMQPEEPRAEVEGLRSA
ncbi:MAG: CBS domain-containing protein [bacterium]|nr:CBS domain-containing protein [bacterium]